MTLPDRTGHFGEYGGKFVPETLMALIEDLEKVAAGFVEASQNGALESSLNITLDAVVVTVPEPTPTAPSRATNESG